MDKQQGTLRLNLIQFLPLYLIKTDWFYQVFPDIGNGHAEALSSNGHYSQYSSMNPAKTIILGDKRTKNPCKNKNKNVIVLYSWAEKFSAEKDQKNLLFLACQNTTRYETNFQQQPRFSATRY